MSTSRVMTASATDRRLASELLVLLLPRDLVVHPLHASNTPEGQDEYQAQRCAGNEYNPEA
eukprot:CAMPEP_0113832572 /NCGR_PEP_ID=MMETSP0328-20130328/7449_1 /TAXON_ID=39455 /ORGANISM="Alexandrium minutum" /LENGTH=60 /DNA_ID=CAMNT_0000800791 /DNA_START=1 /DNA_END=180 /DNA_ORIENTATION=+ /assembly_acc=CAM_ASM_000350